MPPYVGEIGIFAFNQIPKDWLPCEGQTLSVRQYLPLYTLIGNTYGGVKYVNFTLPDLRGRVIMGQGKSTNANSKSGYKIGDKGGAEQVALTAAQLPDHTHTLNVYNGNANAAPAAGHAIAQKQQATTLANEDIRAFVEWHSAPVNKLVPLHPDTVGETGGDVMHENRAPFTSVQVCIAVSGIFPSRS